jgi:hypothetical protein
MTAVEFIDEQLKNFSFSNLTYNEIIQQAKEIEKQQIIDACNAGLSGIPRSSKQYYNETFKQP